MSKQGKKYKSALKSIEDKSYALEDAVGKLKDISYTKFDSTVDISVSLGINPRKSDQIVRGAVVLPAGTGKKIRILVLCEEAKEEEAKLAGAEFVGLVEYLEKIRSGWLDVDVVVATPGVMSEVGKIGKILGPRNLMPNPKSGTVTNDIAKAVSELKGGKIEFRTDKGGVIHGGVGKVSFSKADIVKNVRVFLHEIIKLRPSSAKGTYLKSVYLSSTMSPSLRLDRNVVA